MRLLAAFLILAFCPVVQAQDQPKIDAIELDLNDRRIIIIHFDRPVPSAKDVKDENYWLVFSKGAKGVRKHTVVGVDVSLLDAAEAEKAGIDASRVENSVRLQLIDVVSTDAKKLHVSLINANAIVHVEPKDIATNQPAGQPFKAAKGKDDSDIYFKGSYTAALEGDPTWDIDAFAGYLKAIQVGQNHIGRFGSYSEVRTKQSKKADPNSFRTYLVYQRVVGDAWFGPFQAPYINFRFAGWEFDRKGKQRNFVTSPVMTFPFRLSGKLTGPLEPGLTVPHMTLQMGTEFVNVRESVLAPVGQWHTRGLLGATFSTGYAPERKYLHSIKLTSSYQVRLPSEPEIFFDDRFAPIDPMTGKKGDTPPMLGTQPRHSLSTKLSFMLVKSFGITVEHGYGSLPPVFNRTGNTVTLGLTYSLQQTSYGRYSILKP